MKRTRQQILAEIRRLKANPDSYDIEVVRADPYSLVAQEMMKKVPHSEVFADMSFKQVRAYCKNPLMTALYNSRQQPIEAFGEDTPELEAFYATLHELFPGAMNVLEALNESWDNTRLHNEWLAPDGHRAYVKVMETVHGTLSAGGLEFAYTYHANQPSDRGTSLAPNFIHTNDGFIPRHIVEKANFQVFHVHDEIKAHPNNMGKVTELYTDGIVKIIESRPLETYLGRDLGINYGPVLDGLAKAQYHLC